MKNNDAKQDIKRQSTQELNTEQVNTFSNAVTGLGWRQDLNQHKGTWSTKQAKAAMRGGICNK